MKKIYKFSLIVSFTIFLLSNKFANAQQHVTTNTTWNIDQIITQPIIIDSGIVLTINEGVKVQTVFVDVNNNQIGDVYIEVNGKLVIKGNPCNPVVFKPYSPTTNNQFWEGIKINSVQKNDSLNYFEVYNAYIGIVTQTSAILTGIKVYNSFNSGLSVELISPLSSLVVNNIILKNDGIGIDINNSSNVKIDWCKADSCTGNGISINNSQNIKINNSLIYNNKGHGIFSDLSSWTLTDSRISLNSYFGISNSRSTFTMTYCDVDTNNWGGIMIGAGSNTNITYSSIFSNQGSGFEVSDWYLDKNFNAIKGNNPNILVNNSNIFSNHETFFFENNRKIFFDIPNWGSNIIPILVGPGATKFGPTFEIPFGCITFVDFTLKCGSSSHSSTYRFLNYKTGTEIMSQSQQSTSIYIYNIANKSVSLNNYDTYQMNMSNNYYFTEPAPGLAMYNFINTKLGFGNYELNSTVNSPDNLNFQNNYWGTITGVNLLINDVNDTNVNYSGYSPMVINTAHSNIYNSNVVTNNFPTSIITTNTNINFICGTNGNLTLNAPIGNGMSYNWYYNNTNINNTNQTYLATITGNYKLNISNGLGCNLTTPNITVLLKNITNPVINTSNNLLGCFGDTVTLTSANINGVSYQYFNGANNLSNGNNKIFKATTSGSYYVVVTDTVSQCQATSNIINTSIIPYPTVTASTQGLPIINCIGGYKDIIATATGSNLHYQWKLNNVAIPNSDTSVFHATQQGIYTVVVSNENGCSDTSAVVTISNNNLPAPTITLNIGDTTICNGNSLNLIAYGGSTYSWSPNAGLNTITGNTVTATPTSNTTYVVTGTASNGCSSTITINISLVNAVPSNAGTISGTTNICQGQGILTYSIPLISNATAYEWSLPNGVTGYSTTNTININFTSNAQSGNIKVKGKNICGYGNESVLAVIVNQIPSIPLVTSSASYCQNASTTSLTATGTNLLWYTSSTGGNGSITAPVPSSNIVGTTNYYVSQTVNSCESPRSQIVVTINSLPNSPTVTNLVSYCQNANAASLSATGSNLLWYTTATGGTSSISAPIPSTSATGTNNYYVSQTISGCESSRSQISVTVNSLPNVPIAISPVTYCQNASATVLNATGNNLLWYSTLTGGTGNATIPIPSTTFAGTTNYYVSQTVNSCESQRTQIVVNVNSLPNSPTITNNISYCQNATPTALTATGNNLLWYTSNTGGSGNSSAPIPLTNTVGNTNYYVSQTVNGCESPRAQITVTINSIPSAPSATNNVMYCQNSTPSSLVANGTYLQWYNTPVGGSGSLTVPTPSTSSAGTTYYYVSQTINGCESPRSQISVVVNVIPSLPIVTNTVSYCHSSSSTALTASGNNLLWYTTSTGGIGNITSPIPSTSVVGTTNYYVSQTINGCESPRSEIAVIINSIPSVPMATNPINYCQNNTSTALSATGNNLLWYASTTGGTGNINAPIPSTSIVGSTNFYVSQTVNGCESQRTQITVSVNAIPGSPSVTNNINYCQSNTSTALTAIGTNLLWYNSAIGGIGNNSAPIPSTTLIGITNYYVSQTVNSCESPRAEIIVSINPIPQTPIITQVGNSLYSTSTVGNQWYFLNTGLIQNATGQTYNPQQIGDYFAIVTMGGCSSDSSNILHFDNSGIAINNLEVIDLKVFPNPFTYKTTFLYTLNESKHIRLSIIDITGREIKVLCDNKQEKGKHSITFEESNLPSGIYYYRIDAGDSRFTGKLVLTK
ncbi:MAG: T9SS type A sorting domain-containing protein [Bacteroidales bacterium]